MLREENKYTVSEICEPLTISKCKYYNVIKGGSLGDNRKSMDKEARTYLSTEMISFIKKLLDDREKCFSARDIKGKLFDLYSLHIPKSTMYYCITKSLGYSFKKVNYRPKHFY